MCWIALAPRAPGSAGEGHRLIGAEPAATCGRHAVALARADGAELDLVAQRFERLGMILHAAEARAQAAEAHRARGHGSRATAAAAMAWTLTRRIDRAWSPALATVKSPGLTRRQRETTRLAAEGLTSRQIAERLGTSVRTVDNHLHAVYHRLGVSQRSQLRDFLRPSLP